jgi:hypothetical protein
VLSYTGIHTVAVQAGVSHRLARGYPLILDVLLVVILAAVLALRGAGWPSRLLAWVSLLALLAAAAGADALHAVGRRLPTRPAAVTAAILPWALVLIAFVLLLAMLRHARLRRLAQAAAAERGAAAKPVKWQPLEPPPLSTQPLVPGFPPRNDAPTPTTPDVIAPATDAAAPPGRGPNDTLRLVVPRPVTPASGDRAPAYPDLAIDAELAPDDPSTDEAAPGLAADGYAPDPDAAGGADAAPDETAPDETARDDTAPADAARDDAARDDTARDDTARDDTARDDTAQDDTAQDDTGPADADSDGPDTAAEKAAPGATGDPAATDPEMPVFHRMWSSPIPPEGS